jgi:hypothetical protein
MQSKNQQQFNNQKGLLFNYFKEYINDELQFQNELTKCLKLLVGMDKLKDFNHQNTDLIDQGDKKDSDGIQLITQI